MKTPTLEERQRVRNKRAVLAEVMPRMRREAMIGFGGSAVITLSIMVARQDALLLLVLAGGAVVIPWLYAAVLLGWIAFGVI